MEEDLFVHRIKCVGNYGERFGTVDSGCMRRFRQRRLVTYLLLNGFRETFTGLLNETDLYMSVAHLSRLVVQGQWDDAMSYASRFLGPVSQPQSDEARVLLCFLRHFRAFDGMVTGEHNRDVKCLYRDYKQYLKHDDSLSHDALRIRSITISLLYSDQIRASLDWDRVQLKASDIVRDLAYKVPELSDLIHLPRSPMMPHDVFAAGIGRFRQRRHVKQDFKARPKTLAKFYLRRKRMSCSTQHRKLNCGLTAKTRKWLADIIDESLQAGNCPELQSSGKEDESLQAGNCPELQSNGKEGVCGAPVSRTMPGCPTNLNETYVISSLSNAGTNKHASPEGSNLRKNPRMELTTSDQDPRRKMQRTTGAFGETSLVSMTEVGTGAHPSADAVLDGIHSA